MKRRPPQKAIARADSAGGGVSAGVSLAAIFLGALLVRLLHVWQIRASPFFSMLMGDSKVYDAWAREIAAGDWIGHDVFYQAPLYPYFLGVVFSIAGHDLFVLRLVQILLGSIACVLVAHATWRLISPRAGVVAGVVLALYPPAIFFDALLQKTVLDAFLISVAIWIVGAILTQPARTWRWIGLGVTLGALSLTRENALALVAVVAAWALVAPEPDSRQLPLARRAAGQLAPFVLGAALVLLPVAVRNYAVGGGFYLTTSQFGTNFYLGNNARTDGTAGSLVGGRGSAEYERQDAIDLAERASGRTLSPGEVSSYWTGQAVDYITSQPGSWLKLMARKFALLWNRAEAFDTESQESYAEWSTPLRFLGPLGHFGILVPLACFGVWVTWPARSRLWILYVLAGAYAASIVVFFIYARYRFPLVPFLVIFAAAGLAEGAAFLRQRSRNQIMTAAAVAAGVALATNWPMLSTTTMRAVTEHNLGAALQSEGRLDEAVVHYRRAVDIKPDYAPAYSNMGAALKARGDVGGAIAAYQRAIEIQPDFPDAHYNLGNALLDRGDAAGAIQQFRLALAASPNSIEARTNLAVALAAAGRLDEAASGLAEVVQLAPRSATVHRVLGQVLADLNRPDAESHLRQAVALAPEDGDAHLALARWLLERNRAADSIPEWTAALRTLPESADLHNDFGIALATTGQPAAAAAQFQRALQVQPGFEEARKNLAALSGAGGDRRR